MAYTPENNPYIPGDPYSYDLKWIVKKLKELNSKIENIELSKMPLNFANTDAMIRDNPAAKSIVYCTGYYSAGDGGGNYYYVTDDIDDILNATYFITINDNKWAIPIIDDTATPEMFGAKRDNTTNDADALQTALLYPNVKLSAGTYLISTAVNIPDTCKKIFGAGEDATFINCIDDFLVIDDTNNALEIYGFKVIGHNTGSAIKGRFYNMNVHDLHISNFNIALDVISNIWTGFNHFEKIFIDYCTNGLSLNVTGGFNDNNFIDVALQHCDIGFNTNGKPMEQCSFLQCNFERNNIGVLLGEGINIIFEQCYIEGNINFMTFHNSAGYFGSTYYIRNCWIYEAGAASDGWLVLLGTRASSAAARAMISIENCYFKNYVLADPKPFAFDDNGTTCYAYINIHNCDFVAIPNGHIIYMDLFNTNNFSGYAENTTPVPIDTDLTFEVVDTIEFFRHATGNPASQNEKYIIYEMAGRYSRTSIGHSSVDIVLNKRVVPSVSAQSYCAVAYTDNTETCQHYRALTDNIRITVNNAKTTQYFYFTGSKYKVAW